MRTGDLRDRKKALAVLAKVQGIPGAVTCKFLGLNRHTYLVYNRAYGEGGADNLFTRQRRRSRKSEDRTLCENVFSVLHEPPSAYGLNRTSWRMEDLAEVLSVKGTPACLAVIREITKKAGYKWRKARIVLTSSDPEYAVKLAKLQHILRNLRPDEAFFSVDEFGPFAVKTKPGRVLAPPGKAPSVDQWQKSRGCLILTAALELSENQVAHFYSLKKDTDEMIKMLRLLADQYQGYSRIFLSWDAASWHMSKKLLGTVEAHNRDAKSGRCPMVELVPLPAGAQFLNVIESVFSGMARAIIHNSSYETADAAVRAIDRYFAERNAHFRANPKRAGNKIWGLEREPPVFSPSHNCKDPAYR
ncbi:IS630 family transposase [Rhizobium sp. TH2]|nr:IS630 family transposase [Rhizobium sp. TH2]